MNVQQITMPRSEARRKLRAVRQQLHRRADAEYERLEQAYKAAAAGKPLIVLSDVIRNAPRDVKGRPRLAIARADRRQVEVGFANQAGTSITFDASAQVGRRSPGLVISLNYGLPLPSDLSVWQARGFALVPIVPPDVRGTHALDTHHVLWEVEQWSDRRIGARPDRDPYLVKHIGGDLWAVVAEWDLTDIERAVMAARAEN